MQFLGYGCPKSKIWFIGIEEGGKIEELNSELKQRKEQYIFREDAPEKTKVWDVIAQLMFKLFEPQEIIYSEYRKKIFSQDYNYFFLTNLFPLPRPNTNSWPSEYEEYFGIKEFNCNKYLSMVRSYRYKLIYNKWKSCGPKITICYSSTFYHEFIHLLNLGHSKYECLLENKIYFYPDENVLLTPFFNNMNINKRTFDIIKEKLSKLFV